MGNYLIQTYHDIHFKLINCGISSLESLPHAFRLKKDVLDKGRIDLLFIEASVNDRGNNTSDVTQWRALEGIVRHMLSVNPFTDIVLLVFADEAKIFDYQTGKVPAEV